MKNENFTFRTWVMLFNDLFFIAPVNLIDEETPDTSKWVTLAKIRRVSDSSFEYSINGNSDFMPEFNDGKILTDTAETTDMAMYQVEEALEAIYPVNEEPEEP